VSNSLPDLCQFGHGFARCPCCARRCGTRQVPVNFIAWRAQTLHAPISACRLRATFIMLRSLAALLIFQCLGESVSYVFSLPVPGPVIGMLLLFAFAMMRPAAAEAIEPTALELLRHLSLLFIPAGVGIMVSAQAVRGEALAVIASLVVSTTLGIAVTALVTRALLRRQRRNDSRVEQAS
jgi:holin-like protein